jgi:tRNA(Ile)-lysidine synthase
MVVARMIDDLHIPWLAGASKRARWLVGVSGGADSVAMLHLMTRAGFRDLVVCHLDHGLRGRASTGDARFVRELARRLDHPCECRTARIVDDGSSLETAARKERHAFFADCARKWKTRRLVLAHHADDQAETVVWNLLRGSHGAKGMARVKALRIGRITLDVHRPLLGTRRAALTEWLRANRLHWREDATNHEPFTIRNRLRNEALPLLENITHRDAASAFSNLAADFENADEITRWAVGQANAVDPAGRLHLPVLRQLPAALRRAVVADFLAARNVKVTRAMLFRCLALIDPGGPRSANLPGGQVLRRRAGRLLVDP